eukprot:CAMPEP_0170823348 /NCGR_PEP_ID=MMETSP0733-20121128/44498_1 /TAXON_ID=186038 /ORGANISM="Fragilariopsis kerguelensis, Strain L26-C5" /LENGTH=89 /DNA_ID=CAMNT_0011186075 /DNA_START=88 /DNA_END=354 /DNA_ORIENTATION=+
MTTTSVDTMNTDKVGDLLLAFQQQQELNQQPKPPEKTVGKGKIGKYRDNASNTAVIAAFIGGFALSSDAVTNPIIGTGNKYIFFAGFIL